MSSEAHQPDATARGRAATHSDDETGPNHDSVVIAFPTRQGTCLADQAGHDNPADEASNHVTGNDAGDETPWRYRVDGPGGGMEFTGHVSYVDGVEGERLRRELAAVTRELLTWAAERKRGARQDGNAAAEQTRQDRAA